MTGTGGNGTSSEASLAVGVRPRAVFFCESFGGRPRELVGHFGGETVRVLLKDLRGDDGIPSG